MSVTALLDLRLKPESIAIAPDVIRAVLADTRAFPGCLSVDVLVDSADPAHLILFEKWESAEADAAYRVWRAGEGASNLGTILAIAPQLSVFDTATDI